MSPIRGLPLLPWRKGALTGALSGAVCGALWATPCAAAGTAPAAAAEPPPARAAAATARAEPRSDRRVIEDDGVRIEELRVRGQPVRITVQSKVAGARAYEIHPGHGGRDASQERGVAGTSGWRLLSF